MIIIPLKRTHFLPLGTKPTPAADIFHALHSLEGWIQFWGSTRSATCRCQVAEMLEWWQSSNPQGAHQPGMVLKPQMTYPSPGTCMKRHSYSWQLKDSQFRKCGVFTADAVLGFWDLLAASCGYRKLYCFHPAKSGLNRLEKERAGPPETSRPSSIQSPGFGSNTSLWRCLNLSEHHLHNIDEVGHETLTWVTIPVVMFGQTMSNPCKYDQDTTMFHQLPELPSVHKRSQSFRAIAGCINQSP